MEKIKFFFGMLKEGVIIVLMACLIMGGVISLFWLGSINFSKIVDNSERIIGFEEGYKVVEFYIPTKGDVVLIKKIPGEKYRVEILQGNRIKMIGKFYYQIQGDGCFYPKDEDHSDIKGKQPGDKNSDYWGDTRPGYIVLEKITGTQI